MPTRRLAHQCEKITDVTDDQLGVDLEQLERELLGGERRWTRSEAAQRSGAGDERGQELWRALGFADVPDDAVAFTDRDVWALETVQRLGEAGYLDDAAQVAMTRALGQSLARLADWQLAAMGSMIDPDNTIEQAIDRAHNLLPVVEQLMGYVWRRHLAAAAGRALAGGASEMAQSSLAVGFADLVGFSTLIRDIDEAGLAALVEHFEAMASDIVAGGDGRIVKTIGDEVMFVADRPETAIGIGIELSERVGADPDLPDLRVGLAHGVVLLRLGDIYGEPVNIASRLTSIARPGSVLIDRNLCDAIGSMEQFKISRVSPRPVRGYAQLHPFRVRRAVVAAG